MMSGQGLPFVTFHTTWTKGSSQDYAFISPLHISLYNRWNDRIFRLYGYGYFYYIYSANTTIIFIFIFICHFIVFIFCGEYVLFGVYAYTICHSNCTSYKSSNGCRKSSWMLCKCHFSSLSTIINSTCTSISFFSVIFTFILNLSTSIFAPIDVSIFVLQLYFHISFRILSLQLPYVAIRITNSNDYNWQQYSSIWSVLTITPDPISTTHST